MSIANQLRESAPRGEQPLPAETSDRHLRAVKEVGEDAADLLVARKPGVPDYRLADDRLDELKVPMDALGLEFSDGKVTQSGAKLLVTLIKSIEHDTAARLLFFSAERMETLGPSGLANIGLHFESGERFYIVSDESLGGDYHLMIDAWDRESGVTAKQLTWSAFSEVILNHRAERVAQYFRIDQPSHVRPLIVVSCRKDDDKAQIDLVVKHLEALQAHRLASIWCGADAGQDTKRAFEAAIARATLAVLLVTQDYLNDHEEDQVKPILARLNRGEIKLFWIRVCPINIENSVLHRFKPANDRPLTSLEQNEREQVVTDIVRRISEAIGGD